MAASHLLLRVESNGTDGTGGWRRPLLRMKSEHPSTSKIPVPQDLVARTERQELRRHMRMQRRALGAAEQRTAAHGVARILSKRRLFRSGARIAVYLACKGEVNLAAVMALARRRGCELYLPAITRADAGLMQFVHFGTDKPLRRNRFGILEPDRRNAVRISAQQLDAVLLPAVAVDARGWRLGSGAGFYDRSLKHLRAHRRWRRPRLIGIVYEFQRVPVLNPQPWDVPLDAIATERNFYAVRRPDPQ